MPPPARTATTANEEDNDDRLGYLSEAEHQPLAQRGLLTTQGFASEIVTPPSALPVTVAQAHEYARADSDDSDLRAADCRRYARNGAVGTVAGDCRATPTPRGRCTTRPAALTLEPTNSIVSLTRWTDANDAATVVPADVYHAVLV